MVVTLADNLRRRPRLVTSALIVAVTAITFRGHLLGRDTFPWDFIGKESTSPAFVAALFEARTWSEWVPFQGTGEPLSIDPLGGLYFPIWWALGIVGIELTLKVVTVVQVAHIAAGGLGLTALSRSAGLRWRWAAIAGVAFVFFGAFHGGASNAVIVRGMAYLPWLLWSISIAAPDFRPRRLLALPLLAWLIAAGAYPGITVAAAGIAAVYLIASALAARHRVPQLVGPILLTGLAAAALVGAVSLPYLWASAEDLMYRPFPPTAALLALVSFEPRELLGLYLNPFAWHRVPTVMSWSVGIPVLVGLALVGSKALRANWPLATTGGVAFLVMAAAHFRTSGQVMADLDLLFPSRALFSDYKGALAVTMIVLAALGWQAVADGITSWWRSLIVTVAVVVGVAIANGIDTSRAVFDIEPTRRSWLVLVVAVASAGLAFALSRRSGGLVVAVGLLALVLVDGARMIDDLRISPELHPANFTLDAAERRGRDSSIQRLDSTLRNGPVVRPPRAPTVLARDDIPHGLPGDAYGFTGLGYEVGNLGGTIGANRWEVWGDPVQYEIALLPWSVAVMPCDGCDVAEARSVAEGAAPLQVANFGASEWITTTRYGLDSIDYAIDSPADVVVIENEMAWPGWGSDSDALQIIETDLPWRVSMIQAGTHQVTTSFREPTRSAQAGLAAIAMAAWGAATYLTLRRRSPPDGIDDTTEPPPDGIDDTTEPAPDGIEAPAANV